LVTMFNLVTMVTMATKVGYGNQGGHGKDGKQVSKYNGMVCFSVQMECSKTVLGHRHGLVAAKRRYDRIDAIDDGVEGVDKRAYPRSLDFLHGNAGRRRFADDESLRFLLGL
jgi:hypothetical protein